MQGRTSQPNEVEAVAEQLESRLSASAWTPLPSAPADVAAAAEVADFALKLSGKRRQARRTGRLGRLVAHFALAACLALASVAAACSKPGDSSDEYAASVRSAPTASASDASITAAPRDGPTWFEDLLLVDPGSDTQPWATFLPSGSGGAPILVDRAGADLGAAGGIYRLAALPVAVGTRDGGSQFLDPILPAESTSTDSAGSQRAAEVEQWKQDQRYLASTRAIAGSPIVLDAAYNAAAAVQAGGTHSYTDGVVLRVDDQQPVLTVIDKGLLESGVPTKAEDLVYVAIRPEEKSLYDAGKVVNLRDVVMESRQTDVEGQPTTLYVANAALEGSRVEPTGQVDLQSLLAPRLQRVDQDLVTQTQEAGGQAVAATPQATAQPGQTIVNNNYRGGSYIDDFLIFMWLTNSGFFRGPGTVLGGPSTFPGRPSGDMYYSPAPGTGNNPSSPSAAQAAARSTALQAARSSVSGQSAGTGGGVAATNKAAADATARVSAATSKSASVAGDVSSASAGKSIASAPPSTSSTASRSAGSVAAGNRGSGITSGSSSSASSSGSSSSSSSGSKGIGSSSSSSGGFGGTGSSSSGSS